MIKLSNIKHLVLSGGGLLGLSYIGLFKYLEEHNVISQIETITGCSAGAIFGTFLALGFKSEELIKLYKTMYFPDYLNITAESIINFMTLKGLESGNNIINLIKKCIKDKTDDENITFCQLRDKFNINLHIGITNITKGKFELIGCHNQPNLPIYQAINASIAIPFIFQPVIINDDIYCDGGLLDNLPIEHIIKLINTNTNTQINNTDTNTQINNTDTNTQINNTDTNTQINNTDTNTQINNTDTNTQINNTDTFDISTDINHLKLNKSVEQMDTLGIYLINNFNQLNSSNYKSAPLSHYLSALMHTICNEFISNKINNEMKDEKIKNRYKIIVYEIPCDIMTFIKLNATHDDVDNIINIAYNTTTKSFINTI
jgi:predicted acylesterase/phospholipase RssA